MFRFVFVWVFLIGIRIYEVQRNPMQVLRESSLLIHLLGQLQQHCRWVMPRKGIKLTLYPYLRSMCMCLSTLQRGWPLAMPSVSSGHKSPVIPSLTADFLCGHGKVILNSCYLLCFDQKCC